MFLIFFAEFIYDWLKSSETRENEKRPKYFIFFPFLKDKYFEKNICF